MVKIKYFQIFQVIFLISVLSFWPLRIAYADNPQPNNAGDPSLSAATPCPAEEKCSGAIKLQVNPIWWNENKLNQISPDAYALASQVLSNPYNTCGPATLAMVMNYLHSLDKPTQQQPISVVDVLQAASRLGYYKSPHNDGSLGESDLSEIAAQFGFQQAYPKDGSGFLAFDDFIHQIKYGYPAIVGMRFRYDKDTGIYQPTIDPIPWNHYAVIFGFTDDGQYLWMVNPHPGIGLQQDTDVRLQLISPEAFRAAWTKNDGSEVSNYGEALFLK